MRLATFNVENLFARARALDTATWEEGGPALAAFERFNALAAKDPYTGDDKRQMIDALVTLGVLERTDRGVRLARDPFAAWALLRENRGDFLRQPAGRGDVVIVANRRGDWLGWVELITEPVDETSTRMTAKVVREVAADVLCVVEAEDRPSLVRFNAELLDDRYAHVSLVDGNDPRGIDVGLLTTTAVTPRWLRSHADDPDPARPGTRLFSRDCPVHHVRTRDGNDVFLLLNHFKSQSFAGGDPDPLRARQARRVREIVDELRAAGAVFVAVLGDLNKGPAADGGHPTLEPLFEPGGPLVDAFSLGVVDPGPRPGTFQSCSLRNRLDYVLLTPELAASATAGGVFRAGLWGAPTNTRPPADWDVFPEITASRHAASDHAAVWVDLAV